MKYNGKIIMNWRLSYFLLLIVKGLSKLFYRCQSRHLTPIEWSEIKLMILLGHTSLYEPLFIQAADNTFLKNLAKYMLAPAADKTLNRPWVGRLWRFLFPNLISISRRRDQTWSSFLNLLSADSIVVIAPEGRMMRKDGKDAYGRPMDIKAGVAEILAKMNQGKILICYSGGLHHVQHPGELFPRLFKTIKINLECLDLKTYKESLVGENFRKNLVNDLQRRFKVHRPL